MQVRSSFVECVSRLPLCWREQRRGHCGRTHSWKACLRVWLVSLCLIALMHTAAHSQEKSSVLRDVVPERVTGGLCVQLGTSDTALAQSLASTGRFLVEVLDSHADRAVAARERLARTDLYGLISVDHYTPSGALPYAENLVNLILVQDPITPGILAEVSRVLCPRGIVFFDKPEVTADDCNRVGLAGVKSVSSDAAQATIRLAMKPWPEEMDEWTHPRHSASGNAVSQDTLVGPPRRVRWLAGPWQEVGNMVTGAGCNYYGGVLARDGFNGLRLWEVPLSPSPAKGGFDYRPKPGSATPVAGDGLLFTVSGNKLQARDGRTGKLLRVFAEANRPHHILYDAGMVLAVESNQLLGFDAQGGQLLWTHQGEEIRYVVAGDGLVALLQGSPKRGHPVSVVVLDERTGDEKWQRADYPWATRVTRMVYHQGQLTLEISTLNNDGPGSAIKIVAMADGKPVYDREFLPGMNHMRQARAMFVGDRLWLLEGGLGADKKREPTRVSSIYMPTGKVEATYPAGLAHCFPPVATVRYMFSGVMDLTDLQSGALDVNCITKAACGRDAGWVPAHGLINVTPKHCVCWPMLRGYTALAPARPGGNPATKHLSELQFPIEVGVAAPDDNQPISERDWPSYRHDAWRSASTKTNGPASLATLWSAALGTGPKVDGPILDDWQENPFTKGPLTPPVIAGDTVVVARPDAHQVVAFNAITGRERWRFFASGRVDTAPTLHQGLCLFGSKNGSVYCLRTDDGRLVWRLQVAPLAERIVAYGQLESPWPVPGSVLVVDDVAYFAAGRQSFADGGIFVFAVDVRSGATRWVQRLNSVPQEGYYTSSALEFDNFDLLFRQGSGVAMSRWLFDRSTGKMSVDLWKAFARLNTGGGSVMMPPGCWSYAPRNESRTKTFSPRRPLVAFRDHLLVGCLESKKSIYRRDFDLEGGETFDTKWITGWAASDGSRNGGLAWRSQRLSEKAKWTVDAFTRNSTPSAAQSPAKASSPGTTNGMAITGKSDATVDALVLTADKIIAMGSDGQIVVRDSADGHWIGHRQIAPPIWDGMAVAQERLYVSTQDGRLICLGEEWKVESRK